MSSSARTAFDKFSVTIDVDCKSSFALKIFASSLVQPNSDERIISYAAGADKQEQNEIACEYYADRPHPTIMHAWLFEDEVLDRTRVTTSRMVARGFVSYQAIKAGEADIIELLDMLGDVYGTVHIVSRQPYTRTRQQIAADNHVATLRTQQATIFDAFDALTKSQYMSLKRALGGGTIPQNAAFFYFESNFGRVPITSFSYLSRIVVNSQQQVAELLRSLMRAVFPRHTRLEDKLVDFCTIITRPLIYVEDHARSKSGKVSAVDQWMQLGTFPVIAEAGYDCEDGSSLVTSVIYLLKHCVVDDADLLELQQFARRYTAFITLGDLKSYTSPSYVSHAHVVMMDSRWVQYQLDGCKGEAPTNLQRALTLESTASLSGVWDENAIRVIDASRDDSIVTEYVNIREALTNAFEDANEIVSMCRQYAPMQANSRNRWNKHGNLMRASDSQQEFAHVGSYGNAYVMMTSDHNDSEAAHFLVTQDDNRIGAYADQLMMYRSNVKLHIMSHERRDEYESKYSYVLQQQPKNTLPIVVNAVQVVDQKAAKNAVGYLDIPGRVWDQHNDVIAACVAKMDKYKTCIIRMEIAEAMIIHRMYIYMKTNSTPRL